MRVVFLLSLVAGFALAQGTGTNGTAPAAPAAAPQTPSETSNIPDAEKVRRSGDAITKMRTQLKDVLGKLEEARQSKDVVKLNCVNEKLAQMKGLLRISEAADIALQEAVAKKESESADHEYTKVSIAEVKVNEARAAAEECIGQLGFRTDENQTVDVEEPSDLPKGDPTQVAPVPGVIGRAPAASGTT
jgi:hypothetical protein